MKGQYLEKIAEMDIDRI